MIKLGKRQAAIAYHWRPNFRDYDSLPDMRAVRTNLFVPLIFMSVALMFTGFILFREYRAQTIRTGIAQLESEIAAESIRHDRIVELNAEFMKISREIDEVLAFADGQLVGSDFLLAVSSLTRPGLHLSRIEFGSESAVIEGNANVEAEEASRLVNDFLRSLEQNGVLQGIFTEYKLTLLERAGSANTFRFRIEVTTPQKEKAKR